MYLGDKTCSFPTFFVYLHSGRSMGPTFIHFINDSITFNLKLVIRTEAKRRHGEARATPFLDSNNELLTPKGYIIMATLKKKSAIA